MTISEIFIAVFGVTAIYFSQQRNMELRKYACIAGLIGQPFWFYTSYTAEVWGIFILCFAYTYAWLLGFKNYWLT